MFFGCVLEWFKAILCWQDGRKTIPKGRRKEGEATFPSICFCFRNCKSIVGCSWLYPWLARASLVERDCGAITKHCWYWTKMYDWPTLKSFSYDHEKIGKQLILTSEHENNYSVSFVCIYKLPTKCSISFTVVWKRLQ